METFAHFPWNSESFFWSCLTLRPDCPFYSKIDPKLCYFGIGIATMYCAFLVMVLCDLSFYWTIDKLQQQVDYYINLVRTKVNQVQTDQRRLTALKVRTEKLLKSSREGNVVVTALRSALIADNPHYFNILTKSIDDAALQKTGNTNITKTWGDNNLTLEKFM